MLRTRLFALHKIFSIIDDFLGGGTLEVVGGAGELGSLEALGSLGVRLRV